MRRDDLRRTLLNVPLIVGLVGLVALTALALFGAQLSALDPQAQRLVIFYPDGTFKVPPTPPDALNPLGTDPLGRDQLARILWGARLTFTVVLLALLIRAFLALTFGVLAGWRGGAVEALVTLVTNAVAGVPQLLLALLVAVALRDQAIVGFVVALGVVGWSEGAQFVRGEVARIRAAPYVEAASAIGARTRWIVTHHLLRSLAPQLFGLGALEAGATLLLLAELGFLGVFMSGAVFLTDDFGRPILPVRDRAPEWGQMLAGAQQYAFSNQYVAFVPGVVVAAAVFSFNLLGEGARAATDPFSSVSLSPRAVGALGRGMLGLAILGGLFFGVAQARSTEVSFDEALRLAREAVERVEPGDELIAAVVRFSSESHALAKPEKFNFYFRSSGVTRTIRVGFPHADANAMEVMRDIEEQLDADQLGRLDTWSVPYARALAAGEDGGGRSFRISARTWLVRLVLTHDREMPVATYRVTYAAQSSATAPPNVDVIVDATREGPETAGLRRAFATTRARAALGGPVAMVSGSAGWGSAATPGGSGADRPARLSYSFVRSDAPNDLRVASTGTGIAGGGQVRIGTASVRQPPLPLRTDIEEAFGAVEREGGAALREQWSREGSAEWSANAFTDVQGQNVAVIVTYMRLPGPSTPATFRYDVASGEVRRTQ
ncbi:MAG TPA: ABC transporter permease [Candidatus Limnocylindria bacterium]|nr:ABC transporter permease [Candidatus Limnocylindria bacterium]